MIRVFGFTSILLLSLAIGTATAANYTKPVWYDEVKAESKAKGENMKKCTKRDTLFGPSENERCPLTQKPYVCFFGAKECGLPNALTLRPAAKCTCSGTKWSCEQSPCPNAAGKPPAAVLVDTHPELKGTGTLVFPSASALETLANVDAAIRQTIIKAPDLAASYLRLGFHDCAPNFPGGGGCDGCVNMAKELDPTTGLMAPVAFSNNGVDKGVYPLEPIVKEYETSEVSRADIWAYATLVAVDASQNDLNFLNGSFKVGRRNCETRGLCNGNSTDPAFCSLNGMEKEEELIGADIDFHELMTWMDTHFGFTQDEVVALMGAHTIGQVNRNNSGYIGQWTENNTVLDNDYYVQLIGEGLEKGPDFRTFGVTPDDVFKVEKEFQFNQDKKVPKADGSGDTPLMMLNVDVGLVRDLSGGYVLAQDAYKFCKYRNPVKLRCPVAPSLTKADEYSKDNLLWLKDFKAVLSKMLEKNP